MKLRLFASCAPGIEPYLASEIAELMPAHFEAPAPSMIEVVAGGVLFDGEQQTLGHALVGLGLAARLLVRISEFPVRHFNELEKSLAGIDWTTWLRSGEPLIVRATSKKSKLYHSGAIEERVQRVVLRSLENSKQVVENITLCERTEEETPSLLVRLEHDVCTISLDVSGAPLHRRGYRQTSCRAPLREDLARALIAASGWDGLTPLLDPFCGSGTLLIEAALWAQHIPPGWKRSFAVVATPLGSNETIQAIKSRRHNESRTSAATLIGSDHDPLALAAAQENWGGWFGSSIPTDDELDQDSKLANSSTSKIIQPPIQWFQQDIRKLSIDTKPVMIVTNPPWGDRIRPSHSLVSLYQKLGELRRSNGIRLALITSQRELAYKTGVRLHSAFLTDAGGIKANAFVE